MSLVADAAAGFSSGCDFSRNFFNIGNVPVAKLFFIKNQLYNFSRAAAIICSLSSSKCFNNFFCNASVLAFFNFSYSTAAGVSFDAIILNYVYYFMFVCWT